MLVFIGSLVVLFGLALEAEQLKNDLRRCRK